MAAALGSKVGVSGASRRQVSILGAAAQGGQQHKCTGSIAMYLGASETGYTKPVRVEMPGCCEGGILIGTGKTRLANVDLFTSCLAWNLPKPT